MDAPTTEPAMQITTLAPAKLDAILAKHTCFKTFAELLATSPSYVPTLDTRTAPALAEVAVALVAAGRDAFLPGEGFASVKLGAKSLPSSPVGRVLAARAVAPKAAPVVVAPVVAAPAPVKDAAWVTSLEIQNLSRLRMILGDFSVVSCAATTRKIIERAVGAERWDSVNGRIGFTLHGPQGGKKSITVRSLSAATRKRTGKSVRVEG